MSDTKGNIILEFICIGDVIYTSIDYVINNGKTGTTANVEITIPIGVKYSSSNFTHGIYNKTDNVWEVGYLKPGEYASGVIGWEVTNDCAEPFKFDFIANSGNDNVCIDSTTNTSCVTIKGTTYCKVHAYMPIKEIYEDYTLELPDYRLLVFAEDDTIEITLPNPSTFYNKNKNSGSEWYIKIMNLDNPVKLISDYKIVASSTLEDAGYEYDFALPGQTISIQATENYYILTSI